MKMILSLTAGFLGSLFIACSPAQGTLDQQGAARDRARIEVHPENGTVSVYLDSKLVVENGYSEAVVNGQRLLTKEYASHETLRQSEKDKDGRQVIQVLHSADGLPDMVQRFTLVDGEPFITAELEVIGTQLKSNSLTAIKGEHLLDGPAGKTNFIRVPYDNDTFIRYHSDPVKAGFSAKSAEISSFYENESRRGFVLGSLDQSTWKTGVFGSSENGEKVQFEVVNGFVDAALTRDSIAHGFISGDTLRSSKIFLGWYADWREGMNDYALEMKTVTPRYVQSHFESPYGWNSWGAVQSDLNLDNAKAVVDFFADSIPFFRNETTAYIGLDSYWDNLIKGGLEGDFSILREFAEYSRSKGLKPGIYWAPFVDWGKKNKKVEGTQYTYQDLWTKTGGKYHDIDDARALDPTHPGTRQRIDLVIDKFNEIGFDLIKIDFIGHASVESDAFYDTEIKTGMQAFHSGMQYLVDRINGKMLIYVAISPNLATFPYAHSRRIACDAYADINATEYTLNSTTYGWWQGLLYDYIDADHLVFGNEDLAANRARLSSGIINGTLTLGDDYSRPSAASQHAKTLLNNPALLTIAQDGESFLPIEQEGKLGASQVFMKAAADAFYIALVNYDAQENTYPLSLERLGIPAGQYEVTEIYSGEQQAMEAENLLKAIVPAGDSKILFLKKKGA